jgi:hypothetical protein
MVNYLTIGKRAIILLSINILYNILYKLQNLYYTHLA